MRPPALRCDAGDSANRERKAHALLVPAIAGQIDREKRPHAALHVGEQKVEPVESAQARGGRPPVQVRVATNDSWPIVCLGHCAALGGRRIIREALQVQNRASPNSLSADQPVFS